MPAASGVFKQIAIKKEPAYGVLPTAPSAALLRRVDFATNLNKDTYESNEIRTDLQVADMRHGVRRVAGTLNGELSPGSYAPYLGSLVKRAFAAISAIIGASITIAGAGPTYTLTRAAGSFLTDGIKSGMVVRLTAGTFNALNLNKNLFVTGVTALVITVTVLNASALVAEGPIAAATVSVPGKWTYIPTSGHADDSYAIEEWFSDISQSEVFVGCKFTQASVKLPPTGMATLGLTVAGKDLGQKGAVRYFTMPTAASATGVVASINGILRFNDGAQAAITGMDISVNAAFTGDPVMGANTLPNQFAGVVKVSGSFTAYFEDGALRDTFIDETRASLMVALATGNEANADFLTYVMPVVKLGSADKADSAGGVVRTYNFTALIAADGGITKSYEATTLAMQDSQA